MARMIPSQPDVDAPGSERRVFELLADALPESWVVFHARRVTLPGAGGHPPRELELDFLVAVPERGLLAIEVKGGAVGRDLDGWHSVDHGGARHQIRDPGRQAQHAIHGIVDYIRHHATFRNGGVPAFGWAVCFPDGTAPRELGPDLPRSRVLDAADLETAWTAMTRVLDATLGEGTRLTRETIAG